MNAKLVTEWLVWKIRNPVVSASDDEYFDFNSSKSIQELFYYYRLVHKKPNNMLTHKE